MRVGMIGYGNMGQVHSRALQALPAELEIAVTAIAEQQQELCEKAAQRWPKAALYTDGMAMMEQEELDAVHICLPNHLHTVYACKALELGLPVFLEKPVCLTTAEAQQLREAQQHSSGWIAVGQVVRYFKEYRYLQQVYRDGTYGALQSLRLFRRGCRPSPWFLDSEKSGGVILDLHIHDVDFIRALLGTPAIRRIRQTKYTGGAVNQIMAEFDCGAVAVSAEAFWDVSPAAPFIAEYSAHFEKATVVYSNQSEPGVAVYREDSDVIYPDLSECKIPGAEDILPYYKEVEAFYHRLNGDQSAMVISLEDALGTLEILWQEQERAL